MTQPGRKTAAKISAELAAAADPYRPPPPTSLKLNKEEALIWKETLEKFPPNWVPPVQFPLFAQYCRAIVRCRWCASWINDARHSKDKRELLRAMQIDAIAGRSIKAIGHSLRLTHMTPRTRHRINDLKKEQAVLVESPTEDSPWKNKANWKSAPLKPPVVEEDSVAGETYKVDASSDTASPWSTKG